MNTELVELKQELTISRQQNEILELKYKLQKTQAEKSSRLEDSLLAPNLYEHYQKVALMLSKSGVVPNAYKGKPEDVFVAMAMGYQLGFPIEQSLQDIAVVNGRPCLWGDGLLSLALNHPECQSIDEEPLIDNNGKVYGYECTVVRKGHKSHTKRFTLQDANLAGLLSRGAVWKSYPERMLQMRARSFAIRDKFADALRGLRVAEIEDEDSRIIDAEVIVSTPKGQTHTDKLKNILGIGESINDATLSNGNIGGNISNDEHNGVSTVQNNEDSTESTENNVSEVYISEQQFEQIRQLIMIKDISPERMKKVLDYWKVATISELNSEQAQALIKKLERV